MGRNIRRVCVVSLEFDYDFRNLTSYQICEMGEEKILGKESEIPVFLGVLNAPAFLSLPGLHFCPGQLDSLQLLVLSRLLS